MQYRSIKGLTGPAQLAIFGGFVFAGMILAGLAQVAIGLMLIPGGITSADGAKQLMDELMDPKNVNAMRLAQAIGTVFIMFLPSVLYSYISHGPSSWWLGFNKYLNWKQVALAFALIFLANVVAGPLADFSRWVVDQIPSLKGTAKQMEDTYNQQVQAMSNLKNWGEYFMAIIIMALLPAIFEEMAFRGALQNILNRWWGRPLLAIIVASIIFSFIHMSVYLFFSRIVLGFVLGLLFFKSKNIWVNIIAHFLNNAIAVTQLYFASKKTNGELVDMGKLDPKVEWWVGLLALGAMIFLFRLFEQVSAENKQRIEAKEQAMIAAADPFKGVAQSPNN